MRCCLFWAFCRTHVLHRTGHGAGTWASRVCSRPRWRGERAEEGDERVLGRGFGGSPGWWMAETMVHDGESATTELPAAEIMQASHRVWHEAERRRVRIRRRRQASPLPSSSTGYLGQAHTPPPSPALLLVLLPAVVPRVAALRSRRRLARSCVSAVATAACARCC